MTSSAAGKICLCIKAEYEVSENVWNPSWCPYCGGFTDWVAASAAGDSCIKLLKRVLYSLSTVYYSLASFIAFLLIWSLQTNQDWHIFVLLPYSKNVPVRLLLWLVSTPLSSGLLHAGPQTQTTYYLLIPPASRNTGGALTNWNSLSSHFLRNSRSEKKKAKAAL